MWNEQGGVPVRDIVPVYHKELLTTLSLMLIVACKRDWRVQVELDVICLFEKARCPEHRRWYIYWKNIFLWIVIIFARSFTITSAEYVRVLFYFWLPFWSVWLPFSQYLLNFVRPFLHHHFTGFFPTFSPAPIAAFLPPLSHLFSTLSQWS